MSDYRSCSRCGKEAFRSAFAIWYCTECYREKVVVETEELRYSTTERVKISKVEEPYNSLYCYCCDNIGNIQASLDDSILVVFCNPGCLKKYMIEFHKDLPLTKRQCQEYGII